MQLEDFQIEARQRIDKEFLHGRKIGLQLPTGSGKTEIAIDFLKNELLQDRKSIFVVRSIKLIDQTWERFIPHFPTCGIIRATDSRRNTSSPINIMSIDTFKSWYQKGESLPYEFSTARSVIIDEAHDCSGEDNAYIDMIRQSRAEKILGLSATFQRIGRKAHVIWDNIIAEVSGWDLLNKGWLPHLKIFSPKVHYSTAGVTLNASGDFNSKSLVSILEADKFFYSDLRDEYEKRGGRETNVINFCIDIEHCKTVYHKILGWGGNPILFHSNLSTAEEKAEKAKLNDCIRSNKPFTICSVNMLSRGVDIPCLKMAFMLRPTTSEVLYRQQVGRLTRGKDDVQLIDLSLNSKKFSHPYNLLKPDVVAFEESLRSEKNEMHTCGVCYATYDLRYVADKAVCPSCGIPLDWNATRQDKKAMETLDVGLEENDTRNQKLTNKYESNMKQIRKNIFLKKKFNLHPHWEYSKLYKDNLVTNKKDLEKLWHELKHTPYKTE